MANNPLLYNPDNILNSIISWINDITLYRLSRKYLYAGPETDEPYEDRSKSYILGKFIMPRITLPDDTQYSGTCYLYYLLDVNIRWGHPELAKSLYGEIDEHIIKMLKGSLLSPLNIEIIRDEKAKMYEHEKRSKCRSEQTDRYLYEDTIGIWYPLGINETRADVPFTFVRDSGVLLHDKQNVYAQTGKTDFSDYLEEVESINSRYDLASSATARHDAYEEYKEVYHTYFGKYPQFEEGVTDADVRSFRLLDWTDYSIKERKRKIEG